MNFPNDFVSPAQTLSAEQTEVSADQKAGESNELLREGISFAKAGDRTAARHNLLRATDLKPDNETAWLWLASISEQPAELLGFLDKVLNINPFNERALQWSRATRALLAKALVQKGAALVKEEKYEEAAKLFHEAVAHDDENETAWLWLASVAAEPEDKLSYLQRVLNINPNNEKARTSFNAVKRQVARSLLKKGSIAAVSGDLKAARTILSDVMDYADDIEDAWLLNAFLAESIAEKAASYRRALELNPNSKYAVEGLETLRNAHAGENTQQTSQEMPAPDFEKVSAQVEVEAPSAELFHAQENSEEQENLLAQVFASNTLNGEVSSEEQFSASETENLNQTEAEENAAENVSADAQTAETFENQNLPQDAHETTENADVDAELNEENADANAETLPQNFTDLSNCFICGFELSAESAECSDCGMLFDLSKPETMLTHEGVNQAKVRHYIEQHQNEHSRQKFSADDYRRLGIAHFNLHDVKNGSFCLQQAQKFGESDLTIDNFLRHVAEIESGQTQNSEGENSNESRTILVVDDSPTVRKLISVKLEKVGHRVITANDGLEALSKLNETIPDLILLDITMPRLDGYQLCKLVRGNAATRHIPIVMISGKDGFFDKVRGRMAGSTAYITKPFGPETLIETVQTYCVQNK